MQSKSFDVHTKAQRSYNMSQIKGKNTRPELLLRSELHKMGFRFRIHQKDLPGKPDIVLKKYKTIIFVNGCFWHGHRGCKNFVIPKTRTEFWKAKIERTKENDSIVRENLLNQGWNIIVVWECQLKSKIINDTLSRINKKLLIN